MLKNFSIMANGTNNDNSIMVKMIYNNTGTHPDYKKEWGLALWIEEKNNAILFDTGGNPETLKSNLNIAGVDLSKLSAIIISHNHWDHVLGIPAILENNSRKITIYVPGSDSPEIENQHGLITVKPITAAQQIADSIWSTGEMKGSLEDQSVFEQSVIIVHGNRIFLFTGCAHPGIIAIAEKAMALHPGKELALVAGGFHLLNHTSEEIQEISNTLNDLQVKNIAPSHCTGEKAIAYLKTVWKDRFIDLNIGDHFII